MRAQVVNSRLRTILGLDQVVDDLNSSLLASGLLSPLLTRLGESAPQFSEQALRVKALFA